MWRFLVTLLAIPVCACAAVPPEPGVPLYETYKRYRDSVSDGTVVERRGEFFAQEVLQEVDVLSGDTSALKQASRILDERSHHEKLVGKSRGCLTVNGYSRNGHPVSLFLDYKLSGDGKWLTTFTRVYIPEPEVFKGFFEEALCPDEAHQKVMREFEQGR